MSQNKTSLQKVIDLFWFLLIGFSPLIFWPDLHDISNPPKLAFIHGMIFFLFGLRIIKSRRTGRIFYPLNPVIIPFFVFVLVSGLSLLWARDIYPGGVVILHWAIVGLGFILYTNAREDMVFIDRTIWISLFSAAVVSAIGIIQYLMGLEWIPQAVIPASTFANKNVAIQFISLIFPLSIGMFILSKGMKKWSLCALLVSTMMLYSIYSRTRAGWVSMGSSIFIFSLLVLFTGLGKEIRKFFPRAKIIIGGLILVMVALLASISPEVKKRSRDPIEVVPAVEMKREGATFTRLISWRNSLPLIGDHLLLGVGLGNLQTYYPLYHRAVKVDPLFSEKKQMVYMHNEPLHIMAETGLLGLLAFLAVLLAFSRTMIEIFRSSIDPEIKLRGLLVSMALFSFFINSLFTFPLRMAVPPLFVMILLGLGIHLYRLRTNNKKVVDVTFKKPSAYFCLVAVLVIGSMVEIFDVRMILASGHYLKTLQYNSLKQWSLGRNEGEKAKSYIPWDYQIRFELGRAYDHLGRYEESIAEYKVVLKHQPYYINGLLNIGKVYAKMEDYEEALLFTREALRIEPDFPKAHYNMGVIREKQGFIDKAIASYKKALEGAVGYAEAHFRLGILYTKKSRLDDAAKHFKGALDLKPELGEAHFNLGAIYFSKKDFKSALSYFKGAGQRGITRAKEMIEKTRKMIRHESRDSF